MHDITAARQHALPALCAAAARGLKTLTDKGYVGAGIGISRVITTSDPHIDTVRNTSEARVAKVLNAMCASLQDLQAALSEAGSGDQSSWNPVRNARNLPLVLDRDLRGLESSVQQLLAAGEAAADYVKGDRLSLP